MVRHRHCHRFTRRMMMAGSWVGMASVMTWTKDVPNCIQIIVKVKVVEDDVGGRRRMGQTHHLRHFLLVDHHRSFPMTMIIMRRSSNVVVLAAVLTMGIRKPLANITS